MEALENFSIGQELAFPSMPESSAEGTSDYSLGSEFEFLERPERTSAGGVVGLIIIVVLLVLGGLVLWSSHVGAPRNLNTVPLIPPDSSLQAR